MKFNIKVIFIEELSWCYLTHIWGGVYVLNCIEGISPKVNVIAALEFELVYNDVAVQHVSHYDTETHPSKDF